MKAHVLGYTEIIRLDKQRQKLNRLNVRPMQLFKKLNLGRFGEQFPVEKIQRAEARNSFSCAAGRHEDGRVQVQALGSSWL